MKHERGKQNLLLTNTIKRTKQVHERQTERMRTRSEWFLRNRSGLLELNADNHHLRPPSIGTTSIGSSGNYFIFCKNKAVTNENIKNDYDKENDVHL